MKKRLFLLLAGIAMATTSFAQTPTPTVQTTPPPGGLQQTPEQLVERRAQYLAQQLGLSPDQQAKLRPLLLAQREQMQALREQRTTGGRRLGTVQDMKATQAKFDEQLRTVLSPEQYTKFDQMRGAQRDKLRERRAPGQPAPQPE